MSCLLRGREGRRESREARREGGRERPALVMLEEVTCCQNY